MRENQPPSTVDAVDGEYKLRSEAQKWYAISTPDNTIREIKVR
jgi:hypothetical protein